MVESKVTRIGGTFFARIPAHEAKRLGLKENAPVDLQVRPLGRTIQDVLKYRGAFKGRFVRDDDLWGG